MNKTTPHLWFDKEAKEAAEFYVSLFSSSRITNLTTLRDTPSGDCDVISFELSGQPFMAISAGPLFKFTPAISFLVACKTKEEVDQLYGALSQGGTAMMPLGSYPFSERYAWISDKYGLSWQIMYMGDRESNQKIASTLMFTGSVAGKTEEAINFYSSVFNENGAPAISHIMRYEKGEGPDQEGTVKHAGFSLRGQEFAAMDSAYAHGFTFNEAISFIVSCVTQEEIDYYWEKLSAVPQAEQCGWLKDKYGVSWQIVPTAMGEMLDNSDPDKMKRVTAAFLKMKKFDIAKLKEVAGA